MKDFDAEAIARTDEERVFKVNGVTFRIRSSISARRIAEFEDAYFAEDTGAVQSVELLEGFIGDSLEPGQEEAWRQATSPDASLPLSLGQLESISQHARVMLSGRPFGRDSVSGGTPATTGTSSTDASPSPEATSQT